ncbi:protein starmaker-like [Halichondria panicea]|uniref:protein starmaker-like n=1 Tax=Halichondria panicea TaxID=6063 RepID=UPI00312BCB92
MADKLVHPILKRGHSNWLESSHSVLIRFRQKHVFLERLHYIVSTNLGLLQANMTHEYQQQGADYHWKTELYKKMNLPLYKGVQEVLSKQNQQRKKVLDGVKTEKTKKRRVQLKKLRVIDRQQRIVWTDQHGRDTYGKKATKTASSPKNKKPRAKKQSKDQDAHSQKPRAKKQSKDQDAHSPKNKKPRAKKQSKDQDAHSPKNKKPRAKKQSKDQDAHKDGQDSSNNSDYASEEFDMDTFEDDILSGCICGANGKAHKRYCPMNPKNYHREKNPTRPYNKRLNLSRTFGDAYARIHYDDVPDEHNVVTPDGDAHTKINDSDVECYDGVPDEPDGDDSDIECYDGVPDEHDVVTPDGDAHVPMTDVDSDHEIPDEHVSAHKHISEPHINDRTNAAQPEPQINVDKTDRLEVGMYVYLHSSRFGEQHLLCRIAKKK